MSATTSVLIVDDEPAVRQLMSRWASSLGLYAATAANSDEALEALETRDWDLAVIDVMMPGRNGLWLAGELRRTHPNTAVVLATAYTDPFTPESGDAPGVADLLIKPFKRERFMLALDRGLHWHVQAETEIARHAELMRETTTRVETIAAELARVRDSGGDEVAALIALMGTRTPDVLAHAERVRRFGAAVARDLALPDDMVAVVELTAEMHDVGKLAIPESMLTVSGPLTPGQVAILRRHVEVGADILASSPTLAALAPFVVTTHEWFGGGGYPKKLAGSAIPLPARIVAVADAYDAMTQDGQYRSRLDPAEAVVELERSAPAQFDPELVDVFLRILARQ
jgi:response regulator RpfG family c-di-GMP phosphodiesterase